MRKIVTLLLPLFLLMASFAASAAGNDNPGSGLFAPTASTTLVISQVYGAGGNTGATLNADYVELHNISGASVSTAGLSIQYGSATVTGAWTGIFPLPAATIPAGGYYLIQMSSSGTVGAALPAPDATATPTISMAAAAGRVALVNGTTALVGCPASTSYIDLVGYGTTVTCSEGSNPAPAPSAVLADFRKVNGCTETDNNGNDFEVLTPAPRNSATTPVACGAAVPTISATTIATFGNVCVNTTSAANSFTISGSTLSNAPIMVGALTGYTYSTTAGGTYSTTLSLPQAGGSYSQQIFVKFTPTAVQTYNGNVPVSGGGATAINVAVTGAGVNSAPTVTSGAATAITTSSATVAGNISSNGCTTVSSYGIEYSTVNGFANGTGTAVPSTNLAAGAFSSALSGLAAGTVYYYHAYAVNGAGTSYGAQKSFTTVSPNPTLNAGTLTAFGNVCINTTTAANSFTISGTNLGTANITVGPLTGFTFSTTSGGTYTSSLTLMQTGGTYSQQVFVKFTPTAVQSYSGSIPVSGGGANTINVAASGAGINTAAAVTSGGATAITASSATVAGTITNSGCSAITAYGIEYSTTAGFANGSGTAVPSTNLSGTGFTSSLSGLSVNTVYYYHAYATSAAGTSYGAQQTFTTSAAVITATEPDLFGNICMNATAGPNTFTITSTSVSSAPINISGPAGYTFSTTATGTYSTTLSLTHPAGALSQVIFVKFTPTALQAYNGNITISGGGATNISVAVSGAGVNTGAAVITGSATNIGAHSATLGGSTGAAGCSVTISYGIEYSSISNFTPGSGTRVPSSNLNNGSFTADVNGLVQNTFYYYRAYAISAGGSTYGVQDTFATASLQAGLIIYSSPTTAGSMLKFSINNVRPATYIVTVLNAAGRQVYRSEKIVQLNFIDDNILLPRIMPKGMYVLQVRSVNSSGFRAYKSFLVL